MLSSWFQSRLPRLAAALVLGLAMTAAGCTDSPSEPDRPVDVTLTLAPGQTQGVTGTPLSIRFVGVTGDSRCPADAFCVLGGSATVAFEVSLGAAAQRVDLQTGDGRPASYDRFTLSLVELSPYPFSARPISPDDYRVRIRITG